MFTATRKQPEELAEIEQAPRSRGRPSLFSANLLYLVCITFLLTGGMLLQQTHFGWGLLVTEIVIGLLALLWVQVKGLPWRETLRLYPAPAGQLVLAFLMGLGLWLLDGWLGAVSIVLFGYDVPVPAGMYPQRVPATVLLFVALAIGAPLGEELFFRGYMQRAYERLRPLPAILTVGFLFAAFHLSLVGLPPRVPIALALGYVAWRSNSLWPGVLLHAANNAAAALFLALVGLSPAFMDKLSAGAWTPGRPLPALAGLLLVVVTLWPFHRYPRGEGPKPVGDLPKTPAGGRRARLAAGLSLLVALLLIVGVTAIEAINGRYPVLLAAEPLVLEALPWAAETRWSYRVQHPGGETVGTAGCELAPQPRIASLSCELQHEPFEVRIGASNWIGGAFKRRFTAHYDPVDMRLAGIEDVREFGNSGYTVTAAETDDALRLRVTGEQAGEGSVQILPTALVDELWPWQLAALPFAAGSSYRATLVYPQRYDHDLERSVLTTTDVAVVVAGIEPLSVPAGDYLAWRVAVEEDTAWYDSAPPHTLLQYDSGPLIWQYMGTGEGVK